MLSQSLTYYFMIAHHQNGAHATVGNGNNPRLYSTHRPVTGARVSGAQQ